MSPTTRKPGPQRRTEIAAAALEAIGRRGLSALTTTALAEEIGLSSGALFRHFASRDEILEAAVAHAEARIRATFPEAGLPPIERLRALAQARIALLTKEPGIAWLLRSDEATLALPKAAVDRLRGVVKASRAFIRTALDDAVAIGRMRADVPLDVLLVTFTSTVHALIGRKGVQAGTPGSADTLDGLFKLLAPPLSGRTGR